MSFYVNEHRIAGYIGKPAETIVLESGTKVTKFRVATVHSYKGQDGNYVNKTTWHNVVCYNLAEFYRNNLQKGRKVQVVGRLEKREYTKDEIKRIVTELISRDIMLIDVPKNTDEPIEE